MVCSIAAAYSYFYQTLYGPGLVFRPPVGLQLYLQHHLVTSCTQLEALFVLYNAALQRNPL